MSPHEEKDLTGHSGAEDQFRISLEAVPDAMVIVNQQGEIVLVNARAGKLFGYAKEELLGQQVERLLPERFRRKHRNYRAGYFRGPDTRPMGTGLEFFGLRKDDSEFPIDISLSPLQTEGGILVASAIRDITERHRAEEALRIRERQLIAFFEHSGTDLNIKDAEGRYALTSPQFEATYGLTRGEALGKFPHDVFPRDYADHVWSQDLAVLRTGKLVQQEDVVPGTSGKTVLLVSKFPILDDDGDITGIGVIATDISGRKRAEQALLAEKERAEVTLHSIGDAVITTDAEAIVEYMNPAAEALTDWTVEEARGEPLDVVFHIIEEQSREPAPDAVAQCIREGNVIGQANHSVLISRRGQEYAIEDSAAPIRDREGNALGAVLVFHDVTEARRVAKEMAHQASHDALTSLVNRREFEHRLQRVLTAAREEHTEHALCYLDLDQFKVINDTCGHVAGDELLRELGGFLQDKVRKRDTLARLGGDEFGVLMEHCSLTQANRVANDLREAIEDFRFLWEGQSFSIGVSIGLVSITETSESISDVLSAVDSACYAAKDEGRNRIHVYHADDAELAKRHGEMQWVARIHSALEEHRLQLSFQPIVPLVSHSKDGDHYELLLRMKDEEGRIVLPGAFLPAAERYDLAPKIDRWVIHTAFEWLAGHQAHLERLHLCEINLSGQSLGEQELLELIMSKFEKGNIPPEKICFEVTETAAIANLVSATQFIRTLKERGCRFALDDFGSGLSSFAYLKNLPVDFLKIAGVFVQDVVDDPIDLAMVKSINEIAQAMGKQTMAEFIENEAILEKLREIGVDYAQGHYIGRPRPIEEMT